LNSWPAALLPFLQDRDGVARAEGHLFDAFPEVRLVLEHDGLLEGRHGLLDVGRDGV
jgi:hypothetical protein